MSTRVATITALAEAIRLRVRQRPELVRVHLDGLVRWSGSPREPEALDTVVVDVDENRAIDLAIREVRKMPRGSRGGT